MNLEQRQRLRPIARERAGWYSEKVGAAFEADLNPHQAGIDAKDEITVFVESLPEQDRDAFWTLWVEELDALTAQTNSKAERLFTEAAVEADEQENYGKFVAAIIGAVAFVVFILAVSP